MRLGGDIGFSAGGGVDLNGNLSVPDTAATIANSVSHTITNALVGLDEAFDECRAQNSC